MRNKKGLLLISTGLLLVAAALSLTGYNLYDEYRASQSAKQVIDQLDKFLPTQDIWDEAAGPGDLPTENMEELEIPDYILNPNMEMPVQNIDGLDYVGVLHIPTLGLELPIISEWSYPRLKITPCRYKGSAYLGNLIISGHNYKTHFGGLKNLQVGDTVTFTDMDGNVFSYEVAVLETLMPTAIEEMESGDWDLTLFTCTLGGQSRVTVRCVQKTD